MLTLIEKCNGNLINCFGQKLHAKGFTQITVSNEYPLLSVWNIETFFAKTTWNQNDFFDKFMKVISQKDFKVIFFWLLLFQYSIHSVYFLNEYYTNFKFHGIHLLHRINPYCTVFDSHLLHRMHPYYTVIGSHLLHIINP